MADLKKIHKKDRRDVNISCHKKPFLGTITPQGG